MAHSHGRSLSGNEQTINKLQPYERFLLTVNIIVP